MNKHFANMLDEEIPRFNKETVEGLACSLVKHSEEWVDSVLKIASISYKNGLVYKGYSRVSPKEEYMVITKKQVFGKKTTNKARYELARSDLYLVKFMFEFNDEELPPRYMYLPYVTKGGLMQISGCTYHISPVLSDKVITPGPTNIFVKLLKDKLIFRSVYHNVMVNNVKVALQVINSSIYRKETKGLRTSTGTGMVTGIMHYLLAKYGLKNVFIKYLGFNPVVGYDEVNEDNYPSSEWVICSSTRVIPKAWRGDSYKPHGIRIAVPRDMFDIEDKKMSGSYMANVIGGLFYVLDHYPETFTVESLNDTESWKVVLGYITKSVDFTIDLLYKSMCDHFTSLDSYMDIVTKQKLREAGYKVEDFYDLLALILKNFNEWTVHYKEYTNSIYGRYLDILYYILYCITSGIFKANYTLVQMGNKKTLTTKNVVDTLAKYMSIGRIYSIVKSTKQNIAINVVDYCGDNMYPKITSVVALQECGDGVNKVPKAGLPESSKQLTAPDLALGSLLFLPKSLPTPRVRLNPFTKVNVKTGILEPSDEIKESLADLALLLDGKMPLDN